MDLPKNLLYTKEHEWMLIENNVITLGITDFAQAELGDIIFVELPTIGDFVEKGKTCGTIEAVKTVSDIFSPVEGKVIDINNEIDDSPEVVNSDPYGDGWFMKIELMGKDSSDELMSYEEYGLFIT
tara:strand:- start:25 stop:402 length:378 start_codon:yes stop_codon:yes gene_type:complete